MVGEIEVFAKNLQIVVLSSLIFAAKGLSIFAPDLIRSWLPNYVPTYSYMV